MGEPFRRFKPHFQLLGPYWTAYYDWQLNGDKVEADAIAKHVRDRTRLVLSDVLLRPIRRITVYVQLLDALAVTESGSIISESAAASAQLKGVIDSNERAMDETRYSRIVSTRVFSSNSL